MNPWLHNSAMRALFLSGCWMAALVGCSSERTQDEVIKTAVSSAASSFVVANLEVSNANDFALTQEPLYFSFYDLGVAVEDAHHLSLVTGTKVQPTQLVDTDGDGTLDSLLLAVDFAPAERKSFVISNDPSITKPSLKKQTQAEISIKEGGEWQGKEYVGGTFKNVDSVTPPSYYTDHSYWIRYEGPGIESDKVGYRIYLDWRNGFDIFGKKITDMVLHNVGQDGYETYHHNADWGVDVLKVGKSLGMGGFGFWNKGRVELVSDTDSRSATITNNGDLFSGFRIDYNGWKINGQTLDMNAHFSMTAGSRLVKVQLHKTERLPNLAIGLVKHPGTTLLEGDQNISGYAWTYVASWGKQSLSGEEDHLGMAVIFRRDDRAEQTQDDHSYVSVMKDKGNRLEYYFLAAWEHELGGIKTQADFKAYLDREVIRLTKEPRVRLETALSVNAKQKPLSADAALHWAKALADSELHRKTLNYHYQGWDEHRRREAKFEYDIAGLQIMALQALNSVSPDSRYQEAATTVTGSFITDTGEIRTYEPDLFSIDLTKPGEVVIELAEQTGDEKYRKAADFLRENLKRHPRTSEGAFWHRATYPHQLWLDGVYMGMPFLARYAALYETGEQQHQSFTEAVHEFVIARKHLRDPDTGLYYHAWDESKQASWADKKTGRASQYWLRGVGWYAMALVDVLDYLPESEAELRTTLITIAQELAADVLRYQDAETGTWWQIMDKPGAIANYRESSGSAMMAYFYAKGVNQGYLPASYREVAIRAYQGVVKEFIRLHSDGKVSMTNQCLVAGLGFGRDGSYDYYMTERIFANDPKGNGPFIFAGVEVYKLLR